MKKIIFILFLSNFITLPVFSQNAGISLYNEGKYKAASQALTKNKKNSENTESEKDDYYLLLSLLKLSSESCEKQLSSFEKNHPSSIYLQELYFLLGNYFFDKQDYQKAIEYYSKVDRFGILSLKSSADYNFKLAYSSFKTEDLQKARSGFAGALKNPLSPPETAYYYAHICYLEENYDEALKYFNLISQSEKFKNIAPLYTLNILYKQKQFNQAIEQAEDIILSDYFEDIESEQKSNVFKIIGESSFKLEKWNKVIEYLDKHQKTGAKLSADDYYQLGYAYYKTKNYSKAEENLNKIVSYDNPSAQMAYYVLADCYLKDSKKSEAANAFRSAAKYDFDSFVKEDAAYNAAKLSYELSDPFISTIKAIKNFIEEFPKSPKIPQMQLLLLDSYLSSKDYKLALEELQKQSTPQSTELKTYLQKIAFYYALTLINENEEEQAEKYLRLSLENPYNSLFINRANFWLGELLLRNKKWEEAKICLTNFSNSTAAMQNAPEKEFINYTLGILAMKEKRYSDAINFFNKQLSLNKSGEDNLEIKLLLADCYFSETKYWKALEIYNEIIDKNSPRSDYAMYQKSICYNLQDRPEEQIKLIEQLFAEKRESQYVPQALYEAGLSYQFLKNKQKALTSFLNAAKLSKTPSLTANANVKAALIYSSLGQDDKAISLYKDVIANQGSSQVASTARNNLRSIYVDRGESDKYIEWSKKSGISNISDIEADSLRFSEAENAFLKQNYPLAKSSLDKYLKEEKANYKAQAYYYLAQTNTALKDTLGAFAAYDKLLTLPLSDYTEPALVKYSTILVGSKKYTEKAKDKLLKLLDVTSNDINKKFSLIELMLLSDEEKNYKDAQNYATQVRAILTNGSDDIYCEASVILFNAQIELRQINEAKTLQDKLLDCAKGKNMARVLYLKALIENKDLNFETSNKTIIELTSGYPSYKYYAGKALLLMAQNYYALSDLYQANYILENIIQNFKDAEILDEAKYILDFIKSEQGANLSQKSEN